MPGQGQAGRGPTVFFSTAMIVIGIVMLIRTVSAGGGALASGVILGVLFVAAGAGRLYLSRRRG